ncbi:MULTISPECIES: D-aminoacylase [unclassified Nonomuraea]|uniref:N-acyl-D-amino-acid deacylase family protein n=1 Tax=unclassified Nonomuraea TaxID=2593643 RepID=UPI0033D62EF5
MNYTFRGARVVDGSGRPSYRADVVTKAGVITEITEPGQATAGAGRVMDVDGLVLAPGFIDMHAHSDLALLTDPHHVAKAAQGVTLEVLGQDGLGYAPVDDTTLRQLRIQLAGWNGDPEDLDWDWRTVGGYLDRLDEGIAVNAAYLVPHGTVRALVLGWENRPPTSGELDMMRELVAEGMRQGAVGMSSGLTYPPGMYADTEELVELCRVVAAHGGYHSPHHRSYGRDALAAYAEMIEVSRRSSCPLHLAHTMMNFPDNAGRAADLLRLIDDALSDGCDISMDSYPYTAGSTTLAALLPSWAAEGGPQALIDRLQDLPTRMRLRRDLEERGSDGCHGVPVDWSAVRISGVRDPANQPHVGATLADLAAREGRAAADVYFDLLVRDRLGTTCLQHVGHEENVRAIMRHPAHTVGSDGLLAGTRPHPRAWGTFPRLLGRYVRALNLLTLEECVAKMTSRPARRLGLATRGLVKPGYLADLVLFDPETVGEVATYDEPRRPPRGIPFVMVAGTWVIDEGRPTGARPGRSVRRLR